MPCNGGAFARPKTDHGWRLQNSPTSRANTVGDDIRIRAEIISVDENRITYTATLWDSQEKIGEAENTRAIVDRDRFLSRAQSKASLL